MDAIVGPGAWAVAVVRRGGKVTRKKSGWVAQGPPFSLRPMKAVRAVRAPAGSTPSNVGG